MIRLKYNSQMVAVAFLCINEQTTGTCIFLFWWLCIKPTPHEFSARPLPSWVIRPGTSFHTPLSWFCIRGCWSNLSRTIFLHRMYFHDMWNSRVFYIFRWWIEIKRRLLHYEFCNLDEIETLLYILIESHFQLFLLISFLLSSFML